MISLFSFNKKEFNSFDFTPKKEDSSFLSFLPLEIIKEIFGFLSCVNLCKAATLSKQSYHIAKNEDLWKNLYLKNFGPTVTKIQNWKSEFQKDNCWLLPPQIINESGQGLLFVRNAPVHLSRNFSAKEDRWHLSITSTIFPQKTPKSISLKHGIRNVFIDSVKLNIIVTDEGGHIHGFNKFFNRIFKEKHEPLPISIIFEENTVFSASKNLIIQWELKKQTIGYSLSLINKLPVTFLKPKDCPEMLEIYRIKKTKERLIVLYFQGYLQILDLSTTETIYFHKFNFEQFESAFTKNEFIFWDKNGKKIDIYYLENNLRTTLENLDNITDVSFSPQYRKLIVLQNNKDLTLYNMDTGEIILQRPDFCSSAHFSSIDAVVTNLWLQNNFIVIRTNKGFLSLWNLHTSELIYEQKIDSKIRRLMFCPPSIFIQRNDHKVTILKFPGLNSRIL